MSPVAGLGASFEFLNFPPGIHTFSSTFSPFKRKGKPVLCSRDRNVYSTAQNFLFRLTLMLSWHTWITYRLGGKGEKGFNRKFLSSSPCSVPSDSPYPECELNVVESKSQFWKNEVGLNQVPSTRINRLLIFFIFVWFCSKDSIYRIS